MKTTTQQCFHDGMKMMVWQERNCCQCKKAVFYNEKLGRFPQFRCAVQKQIEGQMNGEMEISQRTFEAAQNHECPFFKSKIEKSEESEAERKPVCNEFAKGQSLVKAIQEKPKNEPKQEYVKIGGELIPKEEAEKAEKRMMDTIKEKMMHGEFPPVNIESQFRKEVKDGVKEMLESFTWQENMMIAFVPLMIADIAWHYADKVMKFCADHRISEVKKLGRAIKEVRRKYMDSLNQDLDFKHIENVQQHSNMFMNEFAKDFTIFWFQVNGAIKREYPEMEYSDMRTDACCCIFMIDFLKQHNNKMDEIIASKMGASNSIMHPDMLRLKILVDAYLPDKFEIKGKEQIDLALKIINKNLWNIDFKVEGE